jgi:hypothetical protein
MLLNERMRIHSTNSLVKTGVRPVGTPSAPVREQSVVATLPQETFALARGSETPLLKPLVFPKQAATQEPSTQPQPKSRNAVLVNLPMTSPMRHLDSDELAEIPDITFRLMDSYQTKRKEFASMPVRKGETVLMVPAYNEEKSIAGTLENLQQHGGGRDIIVSLNNTTDGTVQEMHRWAGEHDNVDLIPIKEDTGFLGPRKPGRSRVFLLESPEPGKVGAMMRPLNFMLNQGGLPEHIFSIDADSTLRAGQLDRLEETAKKRGLHAISGKTQFVAPPGEELCVLNEVTNRVHGEEGFETLVGAFTLYRSPDFFAGYKAIKDVAPGVKTEDGLFGFLVGSSGRPVGVDKTVKMETLGFPSGPKADSQRQRWIQGGAQMEKMFGPLNDKLGLDGMDSPLKLLTTQVKTIFRDNPIHQALGKTLGLTLQLEEGWKSLLEMSRGEEAPLTEEYHWKPQR